jgi:hypothetical protein
METLILKDYGTRGSIMKPARRIRPTKGRNYRSKITRSKNIDVVHAESILERDFVKMCNFDPNIKHIMYQSTAIDYHYKGRKRTYYVDYKLTTMDDKTHIVEVKPKAKMDSDRNKAKFLAGMAHCKENGWVFQVVNEEQIRPGFFQWNLDLLLEVKYHRLSVEVSTLIKEALYAVGPCSIKTLFDTCEILEPPIFRVTLYKLIYLSEIKMNLIEQQISDDSKIWMPKMEVELV